MEQTVLDHIAGTLSLSVETIQCYNAFYFDVIGKLSSTGYITQLVIEGLQYGGRFEKGVLTLCFAGGPYVADYLLLGFDPAAKRSQTAQQVEAFLRGDVASTLTRKAALSMRMLDPSEPRTALQIVKIHTRRQLHEQVFRTPQQRIDPVEASAEAFNDQLRRAFDQKTSPKTATEMTAPAAAAARQKAYAARRAKIAAARRGKPRPRHVIEAMRKANTGRKLTLEQGRKLSEAQKRRGAKPPAAGRSWAPWGTSCCWRCRRLISRNRLAARFALCFSAGTNWACPIVVHAPRV